LVHILLRDKGDHSALFAAKRELLLESLRARTDISGTVDEYLSDAHAANYDEGSYKDHLTPEQIKEFEKHFEEESEQFYEDRSNEIRNREDILEECVVDEWATFLTTLIMAKSHKIKLIDSLQAILVGLHSLRLMSISARQAARAIDSPVSLTGNYFHESIIRISNFRYAVNAHLDLKYKRLAAKIHKEFVSINRKYAAIVQDPILFIIEDKVDELKETLPLNGDKPLTDMDPLRLNKIIDDAL
jgi:hypothetical protein